MMNIYTKDKEQYMILNIIMSILIFLFLPIILGFGLLKFNEKNKSIFLAFVLGFFIEWLVFEILAVPMSKPL